MCHNRTTLQTDSKKIIDLFVDKSPALYINSVGQAREYAGRVEGKASTISKTHIKILRTKSLLFLY